MLLPILAPLENGVARQVRDNGVQRPGPRDIERFGEVDDDRAARRDDGIEDTANATNDTQPAR